jgi:hypothetical protein
MLLLTATTDKFQLITSSAATVDVHASWMDLSGTTVTPGRTNTAISSATTTDIVAAPAASTTRNLKSLMIRNKSTTTACDVTVVFDQNGTDYELHKVNLATGDLLEYVEGVGFFEISSTAKLNVVKYVTTDSVHATAVTFADITGLTQAMLSGKNYVVEAHLFHINNATTTGSNFAFNIGAAPTLALFGNWSGVTNVATGASAPMFSLGTVTARDTAITAQTTGTATITHTIIGGYIKPSADGTFAMRGASEISVAAGMTVKAGSWMLVRETDN